MLRGWLGGKSKSHGGPAMSLNALDEIAQIEDAMSAVNHIMNDDVDTAEELLGKGHSPFHQLGKGVVIFMRATLGFELEIMRQASDTLSQAEDSANEQQRRAVGNTSAYQSAIYPPGTEFAVCLAEARLMSAIVGVLNESLSEAIRGFYKLRKAYLALESVLEAERKYVRERSSASLPSTTSGASRPASVRSAKAGSINSKAKAPASGRALAAASTASLNKILNAKKEAAIASGISTPSDGDDIEFLDADEDRPGTGTPQEYQGHMRTSSERKALAESEDYTRELDGKLSSEVLKEMNTLTLAATVKDGTDVSLFGNHPVDVFILSGSNFCFGILLLIISLLPPAFATLLKIVGFKGDRERGIQMLWQASKFHDIHGAMAGIILLGYYNQMLGSCDVVPQSGEGSYPKARCVRLLAEMRKRYPTSHLWLLEEARMLTYEKKVEDAVAFMETLSDCPLKQLDALQWFERSLNLMYLHSYEACSSAFQKCVTLNNWSHGLYYYIAAACHVEQYRRLQTSDPVEAQRQKQIAETLLGKVTPNLGRKKLMAKQLPFDVFVARKLQKWTARAKEWNCDLIDAVGVSPLEELIYFWNGYNRMRPEHLTISLANLAWSESDQNEHWFREGLDEKAILAVLRATALRHLGRTVEAKETLEFEIVKHERSLFKGGLKDNWTAPCARYEMAANLWREADRDGRPEVHGMLLEECKPWLEEVSRWEAYDLDARVGMKVTTAKSTLRRYGVEI